jgi:excisionase family DNA binding protein
MKELIVLTREELVEIIDDCLARHLPTIKEPVKQPEQKLLYSLRELADFLGCSVVTVHNLKKSGKIRYIQFGRKVIFNTSEIMEDLDRNRWKNKKPKS